MLQIKTAPRAPKETKKEGYIPAVYYGARAKTTSIFVDSKDVVKAISGGASSTVTLVMDQGNETAMIHDLQRDPVKNHPTHVDFYVLEKGQKAHAKVALLFTGESPAVKNGGVLVKVMHDLSVEGDPSMLPQELTVDLSLLTTSESVITANDITLPKGVTLYHVNADEIIASISGATELGEIAQVDLSAIEVEKKGKKEEEVAASE